MFLVKHDVSDLYFDHKVVPIICKYEGTRYTDDPKDPGGPTKFGWTLRSYRNIINSKATISTLKNLTKTKAMSYYKSYFWDRYGASKISNRKLAITLVLSQINLGPYRPSKLLQTMTNRYCHSGIKEDGILGKNSVNAINNCKYVWPGFTYVLYFYYSNNSRIAPVWKWAHRGLIERIFHGVSHD